MKNFILTEDMLKVIGEDVSEDRVSIVSRALTNNWAFIVYPESAPDNWIDLLQSYFIPFAVSPLHDKDFNADGEPKKPHYHILITSESKKSFSQLFDMARQVNGSYLINVGNVRGYYRYFCHLDNPEKAPYKESDIKLFCGFNPDNYTKPNSALRYQCIKDMLEYIDEYNIMDFSEFLIIARSNRFEDWFKLLCDNSAVIVSKYIDSKRKKFFYSNNLPTY